MQLLTLFGLLILLAHNLYISHFLYKASTLLLAFIFSLLVTYITGSNLIGFLVFVFLVFYQIYKTKTLKKRPKKTHSIFLSGRFEEIRYISAIPLSFLKLIQKLPFIKNRRISKRSNCSITICEFIDLIFKSRKNLHLDIQTPQIDINFTIN